ncbi:GH12204 [Drosophila grimshawi]|uniref:Gustatory receptor n=1 Tax=Drosophila grimshawi TaxID=7222 RepID=B4JJQ7_DROGR|nr:GH12204 [Drosophila grimshawi]
MCFWPVKLDKERLVKWIMVNRTDHFLSVYFRGLALSCSAQKRSVQRRLTAYLALVLGEMLLQSWRYFRNDWHINDLKEQQQERYQFNAFAKIIDVMNVAYLVAHMLMVSQTLLLRNRERRLLAELPPVRHAGALINVRLHVALECTVTGTALALVIVNSVQGQRIQLLTNLRNLLTTQAVRARYLQVTLLVVRLDTLLLKLQQQVANGRRTDLELRASYAHIVQLARRLSHLYGFSVLMMNILCIGDFIVVFYAYIILWQLDATKVTWLLIWQTFNVMLPTVTKIWILCAVCHNSIQRSQQLLRQITSRRTATRNQVDEFSLQIMQNTVQFAVCGIYQLNLKTMAGMFLFIIETMVIFLQFVQLSNFMG